MHCVLCGIVQGDEQASIVHADDRVLAFCDLNPVNPGHLHVFPRYAGDPFHLDSGQRRASRRQLDAVAARVRAELR